MELCAGQESRALALVDEAVGATCRDQHLLSVAARLYAEASLLARVQQSAQAASLVACTTPWLLATRSPANPGTTKDHARRALTLLERAVREGFRDFVDLEEDPTCIALWQQPPYRSLATRHGGMRRYASVWRPDPSYEAEGPHGLSPEQHLARCRELTAAGYRPVVLSLATIPGAAQSVAASVWHRPAPPVTRQEDLARRQAAAAAALLRLEDAAPAWELFHHRPDPTARDPT